MLMLLSEAAWYKGAIRGFSPGGGVQETGAELLHLRCTLPGLKPTWVWGLQLTALQSLSSCCAGLADLGFSKRLGMLSPPVSIAII